MQTSDSIVKITQALLIAKAKFPQIKRTGRNSHFRYDYATMSDYHEPIDPILRECGLVLVTSSDAFHERGQDGAIIEVKGRLIHSSGEWIEVTSYGEGAGSKGTYQAITGARKYLFASLLDLVTDDEPESDTNHAPTSAGATTASKPAYREPRPFASAQQSDASPIAPTPQDEALAAHEEAVLRHYNLSCTIEHNGKFTNYVVATNGGKMLWDVVPSEVLKRYIRGKSETYETAPNKGKYLGGSKASLSKQTFEQLMLDIAPSAPVGPDGNIGDADLPF